MAPEREIEEWFTKEKGRREAGLFLE